MSYVNNIRTFDRVFDLGNMSVAARDQRISSAVAPSRVSEFEKHLGVRLFNRTARSLQPTEHGIAFYNGAQNILEAILEADSTIAKITQQPGGAIFVAGNDVPVCALSCLRSSVGVAVKWVLSYRSAWEKP